MAFVKVVDLVAMKKVLNAWAQAVTALPAAQVAYDFDYYATGGQAATRPKKPFVSIKVTGPQHVGSLDDTLCRVEDDGNGGQVVNRYLVGHRIFRVSVQVFADDELAGMMAEALACSFQQPQFYQIITQNNVGTVQAPVRLPLAVQKVYPVRDLTQLLDTKYERRALLEFEIGTVFAAIPSDGGVIDTVEVDGLFAASLPPVYQVALTITKP